MGYNCSFSNVISTCDTTEIFTPLETLFSVCARMVTYEIKLDLKKRNRSAYI